MNKSKKDVKKTNNTTRKNIEQKYYPNKLIGKGSYKNVYDLQKESEDHTKQKEMYINMNMIYKQYLRLIQNIKKSI